DRRARHEPAARPVADARRRDDPDQRRGRQPGGGGKHLARGHHRADRPPRRDRDRSNGEPRGRARTDVSATAGLVLAAGGPVIPNFGGGSSCVVQNHQFCLSWFTHNWSTVFEPRLVEHLELTAIAVGVGMVIAFAAAIFAYKHRW